MRLFITTHKPAVTPTPPLGAKASLAKTVGLQLMQSADTSPGAITDRKMQFLLNKEKEHLTQCYHPT